MWKQGLPQPFCLSPGCFPELGKLSYLIWKRGFRAICWYNFFEFFQANRYYLSMFLSGSRVCHITSTIWSVTLQPLGADQATIPHMKGDWYSFHMRYSSMICYKRLLSDRLHNFLTFLPLVLRRPLKFGARNWMYNMGATRAVGLTLLLLGVVYAQSKLSSLAQHQKGCKSLYNFNLNSQTLGLERAATLRGFVNIFLSSPLIS